MPSLCSFSEHQERPEVQEVGGTAHGLQVRAGPGCGLPGTGLGPGAGPQRRDLPGGSPHTLPASSNPPKGLAGSSVLQGHTGALHPTSLWGRALVGWWECPRPPALRPLHSPTEQAELGSEGLWPTPTRLHHSHWRPGGAQKWGLWTLMPAASLKPSPRVWRRGRGRGRGTAGNLAARPQRPKGPLRCSPHSYRQH